MKTIPSIAILAAAVAFGAVAQSRDPVPVETTHGTRASPETATTVAQPKSGEDVSFLLDALELGLADVRMGELAQQRSQNPAVREFGKTLAADHAKSVQEIKGILATQNVTVPETSPEAETEHAALAKLSGAQFDSAFVAATIESHEQALETYGAQTHANPDKQLAGFASKALPSIKEHLAAAKTLLARS